MIAIVTILIALPAGFFLRSRLAANTAYAVAYLWAFVFQTLYLTLDSINRSADAAFTPEEFPLAYGAVDPQHLRRRLRAGRAGSRIPNPADVAQDEVCTAGRPVRKTHTWLTTTSPTSNSPNWFGARRKPAPAFTRSSA